jgi:hypothetical protein
VKAFGRSPHVAALPKKKWPLRGRVLTRVGGLTRTKWVPGWKASLGFVCNFLNHRNHCRLQLRHQKMTGKEVGVPSGISFGEESGLRVNQAPAFLRNASGAILSRLSLGRNHFPQFSNRSLKSALFALVILVPLRQTGHLALESSPVPNCTRLDALEERRHDNATARACSHNGAAVQPPAPRPALQRGIALADNLPSSNTAKVG